MSDENVLNELVSVILDRKKNLPEGAYTTSLFDEGVDKMCEKIDEEAAEVIKAAKYETKQRLVEESVDLIYHLLVLLAEKDVEWEEVLGEMKKRRG